jgi:TonB-dependent SusC/RagA subfamily outer membrane receptor
MRTKILFLILLSVLCLNSLTGQKNDKKITITGYVVDKYQYPVANASILIDNEQTSIVTNNKGYYKVKASTYADKITIMTSASDAVEEAIGGRKRINITLDAVNTQKINIQKATDGNEPINVGYGTIRKKDLTTSVNKIDGTQRKFASYNSIYDVIRGQVPGVRISGKSIKIQNSSSIYMSTEPLFIVDGIQVQSIDNIPPQMVKSIEFLKGASASIYGSRGANGVILITLIR